MGKLRLNWGRANPRSYGKDGTGADSRLPSLGFSPSAPARLHALYTHSTHCTHIGTTHNTHKHTTHAPHTHSTHHAGNALQTQIHKYLYPDKIPQTRRSANARIRLPGEKQADVQKYADVRATRPRAPKHTRRRIHIFAGARTSKKLITPNLNTQINPGMYPGHTHMQISIDIYGISKYPFIHVTNVPLTHRQTHGHTRITHLTGQHSGLNIPLLTARPCWHQGQGECPRDPAMPLQGLEIWDRQSAATFGRSRTPNSIERARVDSWQVLRGTGSPAPHTLLTLQEWVRGTFQRVS